MDSKSIFIAIIAIIISVQCADVLVGGPSKLSGEQLEDSRKVLENSLTKLEAGDGPNYKLSKLLSASKQVVSGTLYKYVVEIIDGNKAVKKCNVEIWSQPWLKDGIQVTFDCEGEEKIVKKHSS